MVRKNIPLAQQVVNEILTGIESGKLAAENGVLPSEADLGRRFDVSRSTIREALSRLEQRGVVIRRHGVGTFIAPPQPLLEAGLERLESIFTLAQRMGLETHMGETEVIERPALADEAAELGLIAGDPVVVVSRVIHTVERPFAYLIDIVPTQYLNQQELQSGFDGSVLDLFFERGEPPLGYSRTDILTDLAEVSIARKLHMQPGDMLLKLEALLIARDGQTVDFSISYFVPGFFRFRVFRKIDPCDNL